MTVYSLGAFNASVHAYIKRVFVLFFNMEVINICTKRKKGVKQDILWYSFLGGIPLNFLGYLLK